MIIFIFLMIPTITIAICDISNEVEDNIRIDSNQYFNLRIAQFIKYDEKQNITEFFKNVPNYYIENNESYDKLYETYLYKNIYIYLENEDYIKCYIKYLNIYVQILKNELIFNNYLRYPLYTQIDSEIIYEPAKIISTIIHRSIKSIEYNSNPNIIIILSYMSIIKLPIEDIEFIINICNQINNNDKYENYILEKLNKSNKKLLYHQDDNINKNKIYHIHDRIQFLKNTISYCVKDIKEIKELFEDIIITFLQQWKLSKKHNIKKRILIY